MQQSPDMRARLARGALGASGVALGADYHALSTSQVESLLAWSRHWKYRKPRAADGSTARYFHDMLQRLAASRPPLDTAL